MQYFKIVARSEEKCAADLLKPQPRNNNKTSKERSKDRKVVELPSAGAGGSLGGAREEKMARCLPPPLPACLCARGACVEQSASFSLRSISS